MTKHPQSEILAAEVEVYLRRHGIDLTAWHRQWLEKRLQAALAEQTKPFVAIAEFHEAEAEVYRQFATRWGVESPAHADIKAREGRHRAIANEIRTALTDGALDTTPT